MLAASPFVFLNACQVGSANRILGDYGGMADAFLYAGASGVIAPLWSIKDTVAREIALRFYVEAFAGTPPAEIMRRERASFHGVDAGDSATCLAYIWYGHPSLKLSKVD
jgi:CHAT domain-containing protein